MPCALTVRRGAAGSQLSSDGWLRRRVKGVPSGLEQLTPRPMSAWRTHRSAAPGESACRQRIARARLVALPAQFG